MKNQPGAAVLRLMIGVLVLLGVGGCVSQAESQGQQAVSLYYMGEYSRAVELLRPLAKQTDQNYVLNNLRLGSSALAEYDMSQAEGAFYNAYEVINSFGVNNGGRTAGAFLVDEKVKVWKGEPFERAMANFYLGVIYYRRHDYNNARAAFENAMFKLRDYGEGESEDKYVTQDTNFVLGYLMLGKSFQRLGRKDLAQANFNRVAELRPQLASLADYATNEQSNLLLIVDYGMGPRKDTNFDGAIVGFVPKPQQVGRIPLPSVYVDGQSAAVGGIDFPPTDLLVLAQEREWQSIDTVRVIKSAVGTGLIAAGLYEGTRSNNRNNQLAGIAMVGAGILLKATSQSDTRMWEMLPRTTFVLPLRVEPGTREIQVTFPTGERQTWNNIVVPASGEATYYLRMSAYTPGPFNWPPPTFRDIGGVQ